MLKNWIAVFFPLSYVPNKMKPSKKLIFRLLKKIAPRKTNLGVLGQIFVEFLRFFQKKLLNVINMSLI